MTYFYWRFCLIAAGQDLFRPGSNDIGIMYPKHNHILNLRQLTGIRNKFVLCTNRCSLNKTMLSKKKSTSSLYKGIAGKYIKKEPAHGSQGETVLLVAIILMVFELAHKLADVCVRCIVAF
jgi:hypothetical protein